MGPHITDIFRIATHSEKRMSEEDFISLFFMHTHNQGRHEKCH